MGEVPRSEHDPLHPPTTERAHEQTDVSIRPLAVFLGALALSLVLVGAAVVWLFRILEAGAERRDQPPPPLAEENRPTPGPLLQVSPRHDLDVMRQREDRLLNATEWVDRQQGVARVPVERAIELVAKDGFPKWPAAEVGAVPPGGEAERAPAEPAARSPQGSGQTTPAAGGRQP
jgi:hypothetical protein